MTGHTKTEESEVFVTQQQQEPSTDDGDQE